MFHILKPSMCQELGRMMEYTEAKDRFLPCSDLGQVLRDTCISQNSVNEW